MYIHPAFEGERHAMEAFLAERGFGTLVAFGGTAPIAAHVPFLFDAGAGRLALHVARANPIHQLVEGNPRVLLTCTGPDAYVSPDWYVSGGQVPTWNYVAVHATGTAAIMDASMLRDHVDLLAAHFERRLPKPPWTSAKMDPRRLAAMLNAIVGITVDVENLEGQWKLGQHKERRDHDGAVGGLRARGDRSSSAVADLMDRARGIR